MSKVQIHSILMDEPPNKVDVNGLTNETKQDIDIILGGKRPQKINFMIIPYSDHNGEEKFVVGAVYNVVRRMLPPRLPTLLPPPPPSYEIRNILGKGKGIIATRDIALGEIVIVERPILICAHTIKTRDIAMFEQYARPAMDRDVWNNFYDLANVKDDHVSEFIGILETNASEIDLMKGKENYNGVFLELSRLNHSCGPNLTRSWDPYLFTLSAQAVRPIRAGQELTIAYEAPCSQSHANRRYDLERSYRFKCTCDYCTNAPPMSDEVRLLQQGGTVSASLEHFYGELVESSLPRYMGLGHAQVLLDGISKSLELVMMEGVECASAFWHYLYLMKVSGILGDRKGFREWGFKAILLSVRYMHELGEQARREVEQWIDWVRVPERFPDWVLFR